MAALPYMRFYPADYLADAAHLSAQQHGIYLLLIFNYWQRGGPLPADDKRLASIARVSMRDWLRAKTEIAPFFTEVENHWYHSRIQAELAHVEAKSLKSKGAAQASVQRRFGVRSTNVEPTDTDTDTDTIEAKASISRAKRGNTQKPRTPISSTWQPKPFGEGTKAKAITDGWSEGRRNNEVERFIAHHGSRANMFPDWQQAWATWVLNAPQFDRSKPDGNRNRTTAAAEAAFGPAHTWSDEQPF